MLNLIKYVTAIEEIGDFVSQLHVLTLSVEIRKEKKKMKFDEKKY
jgi:hypothetical protein